MYASKVSLFDAVLALETGQDCQKFFDALLSPTELTKIVNRWRVFPLLNEGLPQRHIAGQLQVSLGTVSRVNRILKHGDPGCRQVLKKLLSTA